MNEKRARWAQLLPTTLGRGLRDDEELFLAHTLLITYAEIIAHAVTGTSVALIEPGVFDWVVDVRGGEAFVHTLARRLNGFAWASVEHDLLSGLYQSMIGASARKRLGEYYTPDWLAVTLVAEVLDDPLNQRVLDPACGSGTFVFHAVRRHLAATASIDSVTRHVFGTDVHPIAVALARVNYLLAIGQRGTVQVPIELCDSMQTSSTRDVLIGNPPWLAYRHMPASLQQQFREYSETYGLWQGAEVATHQDLSLLFAVRSIDQHLRVGGKFAFVLPNATLDRSHAAGFRTGRFADTHVAFEQPWDLRRLRPHVFPRGSAVVFGRRTNRSKPMPAIAQIWTGTPPNDIEHTTGALTILDETRTSPYQDHFRQGATLVPRFLFVVERRGASVRSIRTALEKPPWRDLPSLEGRVDPRFIRPVFMGEHVLPHRLSQPAEAVIPQDGAPNSWWRRASAIWNQHRSSDRLTLEQQLDYHQKLSTQFPIQPLRVVYAASGMHLCAARIEHSRAIIAHSLYWSPARNLAEARYLCAILNARCVTELVRPYMSYGKDERHIDKHVWKLPIPSFDPSDPEHSTLAKLARRLELDITTLELDADLHFSARRRRVRELMHEHPAAQQIERIVAHLLNP